MKDVSSWAAPGETLNLTEMDELLAAREKAWELYEEAKKVSSALYATAEEFDGKLLAALKAANKTKYHVDGLGTVSLVSKLTVTVPNTIEAKKQFFSYLLGRGEDVLLSLQTVNSNSLNSWYNQAREEFSADGGQGFLVPGISDPTLRETLRFNKERAKK